MSDLRSTSPQQLFKQWRSGDANAGAAMAQRFSDWYYAITASRLGDAHGRQPLQRACTRFQQGIVTVTNPSELADWAHGLLMEEIGQAGSRIGGGDFANALTGGKSPTQLLQEARAALPDAQVRLLANAYDVRTPLDEVTREADGMGGYPLAVLQARHALKKWLRDQGGIAFTEVPDQPNLDCAPLPLYEAGRMTSPQEEAGFEKWMLSDMSLCKDIAEFGVFALALRAGAFRLGAGKAAAAPQPAAAAPPAAEPSTRASMTSEPAAAPAKSGGSGMIPLLAGGAVVLLVLLAGAALVALKFLG
ncbi:MAG: hypothetical protein ACOZNI_20585 [Myxococcota bacterium]